MMYLWYLKTRSNQLTFGCVVREKLLRLTLSHTLVTVDSADGKTLCLLHCVYYIVSITLCVDRQFLASPCCFCNGISTSKYDIFSYQF